MIDDDPLNEDSGRRTLGVIDGTATQLALAALLLLPTAAACLVWPRALAPMLDRVEPEGRRGMFLAPGAFFLISILTSFILAASLAPNSGGVIPAIGASIREAASEGDVWRIGALILPLFLGATCLGLFASIAGVALRVPGWGLTAGARSGFYSVFAIGFCAAIGEPLTRGLGDPGTNDVFEPGVALMVFIGSGWFYGALLSARTGWPRATAVGLLVGVVASLFLFGSYS